MGGCMGGQARNSVGIALPRHAACLAIGAGFLAVALAGICSLRHGRTNEMQAGSRRLWGLSKGTDETQAENRRLWGASGVFGVGAGFFIGSDGEQAPEDFSFKMFVYNDN